MPHCTQFYPTLTSDAIHSNLCLLERLAELLNRVVLMQGYHKCSISTGYTICIAADAIHNLAVCIKEKNLRLSSECASDRRGGKDRNPQQDFALSIDHCSDIATHTFNIRAATVLRHSIEELYVKLDMIINGKTVLTYSETLCGPGHIKLIFCGKKKGEHLYYEGPVTLGIKEIPQPARLNKDTTFTSTPSYSSSVPGKS
ncbi:hypothetical protein IHE44_0000665 [Lamprotornis superbus]|uniref:MD-2-related lipid-recognition domain-containing protein n=1 Tax=Lamprotornis superbus TaxID=245042 RepID=A0A835TUV5_9PASS|nr:hypothetical protein IHE44_0000665 [Lamprotornis superbus]